MTQMTTCAPRHTTPFFRNFSGRPLDRFFDDFFAPATSSEASSQAERAWMPAVDVKESASGVSLFVDLPGLTKDDIHLAVEENVLTVSGERKLEREEEKDNFYRLERRHGAFSRSFRLPTTVDSGKISASFENGVLSLEMPKAEEAKARSIKIN